MIFQESLGEAESCDARAEDEDGLGVGVGVGVGVGGVHGGSVAQDFRRDQKGPESGAR